jgi:hypothetical protein
MRFLARACAGLLLWALGFSLLYTLHGLGCARGWSEVPLAGASLFRWIVGITWLLLGASGLALIRWARAAPEGLERRLSVTSAVTGLAATLVTGAPVVLTSACA